MVSLSPPDEHGFCSFGVEVGTTKPAAEEANVIIAEVNQQMPRTLGDSFIHISRLHTIVEVDYPLPLAPQGGSSELHLKVGQHIAGMIPDGATAMGIGRPRRGVAEPDQPQRPGHHTGFLRRRGEMVRRG